MHHARRFLEIWSIVSRRSKSDTTQDYLLFLLSPFYQTELGYTELDLKVFFFLLNICYNGTNKQSSLQYIKT